MHQNAPLGKTYYKHLWYACRLTDWLPALSVQLIHMLRGPEGKVLGKDTQKCHHFLSAKSVPQTSTDINSTSTCFIPQMPTGISFKSLIINTSIYFLEKTSKPEKPTSSTWKKISTTIQGEKSLKQEAKPKSSTKTIERDPTLSKGREYRIRLGRWKEYSTQVFVLNTESVEILLSIS